MDFELCQAFRMSWREWKEETPLYVQKVWTDLLNARRRVEQGRMELDRLRQQRQAGGIP